MVRPIYDLPPTEEALDENFASEISVAEILSVFTGIATDSTTGPDHVLMRIVRQPTVANVLADIASVFMRQNRDAPTKPPTLFRKREHSLYRNQEATIFDRSQFVAQSEEILKGC